ncbi:MAG: hypothetical protein V8S10_03660 [Clostridia bacterium]|jgi:hypothetical protein
MELFEKNQKLKKLKEDMNKTNDEILEILDGFLNFQYQTKLIQAGYPDRQEEQKTKITIYYPELAVPNGFRKENERYFRNMANVIEHQYTLVNEKGKIIVNEKAIFIRRITKRDENKNEVAVLQLKSAYIIDESIRYRFEIEGETFQLLRNFSFGDILEQLLGEQHVDYSDPNAVFNEKSEKEYEKFLESLDVKKEKNIPLKNIIKYKERENQIILPVITVHFEVIQSELDKYHIIWLESSKSDVDVGIVNTNIKYFIKLKVITTKNGELLCEKVFEYKEKSKSKYQNGCTLSEIFKLFK